MSIMVGVGRGAEEGILVKNAEALETMEKVDTLVVDKTGTLTEGKPRVTKVIPVSRCERGRVPLHRRRDRGAERTSRLRTLLSKPQRNASFPLPRVEAVRFRDRRRHQRPRERTRSARRQSRIYCGQRECATLTRWNSKERNFRRKGTPLCTPPFDSRAAGLIAVADPIKATTPDAVKQLHAARTARHHDDRRQRAHRARRRRSSRH